MQAGHHLPRRRNTHTNQYIPIMFEKKISVSGVTVTLAPYTEKRRALLDAVNVDIRAYADEHPAQLWDDMPHKTKAEFWKRKADVLWVTDTQLPLSFFESNEFEHTKLGDTEDFFIVSRVRL